MHVTIDSLRPRQTRSLLGLIAGVTAVAGCHQQTVGSVQPTSAPRGNYRFHADIWTEGNRRPPFPSIAQPGEDSVGVFEGIVRLQGDPKDWVMALNSPVVIASCANRGVRSVDVTAGHRKDMLIFSCPGLGRDERLVVFVLVSIEDPVSDSRYLVKQERGAVCSLPALSTPRAPPGVAECAWMRDGKLGLIPLAP